MILFDQRVSNLVGLRLRANVSFILIEEER